MRYVGFAAAVLVLLVVPAPAPAEMSVQACFSPEGRCSGHILREIVQAKKELLIAVYAFTSDELAGAVAQAKRRGVAVTSARKNRKENFWRRKRFRSAVSRESSPICPIKTPD